MGLPTPELLPLLGHWSSVTREQAAHALASRKDVPIESLREMLGADHRFARYGAASALRRLGRSAQPAVEDLIALLESEDLVLKVNAIRALGRTDDARAVDALLELAGRKMTDDVCEVVHRRLAEALFARGNLIGRVQEYENRDRIVDAMHEVLTSRSGPSRNMAADSVLPMLQLDEFKVLWPAIEHARNTYATTLTFGFNMTHLRRLQELRVKEGIDMSVAYLTEMEGWRSPRRVPQVLDILRGYGAHARVALPELERIAHYFEHEHQFRRNLALGKAANVRELIRELEAMDDPGEDAEPLISIADGWR